MHPQWNRKGKHMFATAALAALLAVAAAPTAAAHDAAVQIVHLECDGNESEDLNTEFIVIENLGDHAVDLGGWLYESDGQSRDGPQNPYHFPDVVLQAGQSATVYTGEGDDHQDEGGDWHLYWDRGAAVLRDDRSDPDWARLVDAAGEEVDMETCFQETDESAAAEHDEPSRVEPDCIGDEHVHVTENSGEAVTLSWPRDPFGEDSPVFAVYRSDDGEAWTKIGETEETSFRDTDVVAGATYWYHVVAHTGSLEVETHCTTEDPTMVTVIPFFPSMGAAALAGLAGVAVLATMRRR